MRFTLAVRETFSAAHDTNLCGRGLHGHDFTVEVEVEGEPGKEGHLVVYSELQDRLSAVINEFSGRELGHMLVPAVPEQLCLYLRERLALWFPTITRVRVHVGLITATVEFPLR